MPPPSHSAASPAPATSDAAEPCVLVIFGASGDLTRRKLIPALFDLDGQGRLPRSTVILGVARTDLTDDAFRAKMHDGVKEFSTAFDEKRWADFVQRLHYLAADAGALETGPVLASRIHDLGAQAKILRGGQTPNILFYLSVAPELYEPIIESIGHSGLVSEGHRWCALNAEASSWQRIIIEKPFGRDLQSTISLNRTLGRVFEEEAIFRIDHYLGKELVQNILVMRFANIIFEPIWNRNYIEHIQLSASETVGVGTRAGTFYDSAGALRDMVQSHLLQVLCLVAIEPPSHYAADAIMREKIKLLSTAPIYSDAEVNSAGVLGRYGQGQTPDDRAYVDEPGVTPDRRTETFAAIRLNFENPRWAGVPFYLRSGKKLATKLTEVVVTFKRPAANIFKQFDPALASQPANRLVINIAPRDGISLRIDGKVPGSGLHIASAKLDLDYLKTFGGEQIEAYGPLILDAIRGDRTLYKSREEVEGGWRICDPFVKSETLRRHIATYEPGTWGPAASDEMIAKRSPDGETRKWHNPKPDDIR
ncbi:glucose-6-phosphate dehydrogenase [soil metagenome]